LKTFHDARQRVRWRNAAAVDLGPLRQIASGEALSRCKQRMTLDTISTP
jgi:hypothetical protein